MSVELWANEHLSVSATFGLSSIVVAVYDPSGNFLAGMRGPTMGLAGTSPLELNDAAGAPLLRLNLHASRMGQRHSGRILSVEWPDGSLAGTVYLRTLTRGVTYGLYDDTSQSDVGWMSSQDAHLQVFCIQDAQGAVAGWISLASSELHALSDSKQSWYVSLRAGLDRTLGVLVTAAFVMPPSMLRNTLSH